MKCQMFYHSHLYSQTNDWSLDCTSYPLTVSRDSIPLLIVKESVSDVTILQEMQLILMESPSALHALSKNKGPCDICNGENHPTLRCHILGDEGTLHPDVHTRLNELKQQLIKQKKQPRDQHVDNDDVLPPDTDYTDTEDDEEDDDEDEEAQLVADIKLLQEELMSILLNTPSEVNALSSNAGTCKICGNEHPTLRCRSLTEENIPSALIHRPQQLKLVSEEQQKQKA